LLKKEREKGKMKGKTLLCLALVTSMLLGVVMVVPVGAPSTTIGVEPDSIVDLDFGPGSNFTVEIWVRNVADLAGVEFKLAYNTMVLTATSIAYGDVFGPTYFPLINEINDADGYLHYGAMQAFGEPGVGDGRAAIITFTVDSLGECPKPIRHQTRRPRRNPHRPRCVRRLLQKRTSVGYPEKA